MASAMGGGGRADVVLEGTLAHRMSVYHGVCGSLSGDLTLAAGALVMFSLCAGTETAITTLWPWKVREFAQREKEKADQREKEMNGRDGSGGTTAATRRSKNGYRVVGKWTALREDIQRFMQTILIGATISGVVSTAFITEICGQLFGPKGLGIATVVVTLVQLTLCEILPKSMAVSSPYTFAQAALPLFYRLSFFVYPASKVLNGFVKLMLQVVGVKVDTNKTPYVSEEELDLIFNSAMKSGIVDADEGEMISSVRNLDKKSVKEIMTPLVDMMCIEATQPISELRKICLDTQYSRLPVFSGRFDSIVGMVSMKMLLRHQHEHAGENPVNTKVQDICDKPYFVPETMSLLNALRSLKERTIAICVDEYGGTTGLVTLEDVLEEIVGEIYDPEEEKDEKERAENRAKITQLGPGTYSMSATADVADVSAVLEVDIPEGDYYSIGGFICSVIDRIPVAGEAVMVQTSREEIRFEVVEVDDRKIVKIVSTTSSDDEDEADGGSTPSNDDSKDDEEFASVLDVRPEVELTLEEWEAMQLEERAAEAEITLKQSATGGPKEAESKPAADEVDDGTKAAEEKKANVEEEADTKEEEEEEADKKKGKADKEPSTSSAAP